MKTDQPTKIIAHRGYWKTEGAVQNSIRSLQEAARIGVYGSEFDVYMTQDEIPVVHHDPKIEKIDIQGANYESIREIGIGNGEKLPTLEAYLKEGAKYPELKLILELKPHHSEETEAIAVRVVLDLIEQTGTGAQVEFISFSMNICRQLRRLMPDHPVAYLRGDVAPDELAAMGFKYLDYNFVKLLWKRSWIREAHENGIRVNTWTVDNRVIMRKLMREGVDYLTTNEPIEAMALAESTIAHREIMPDEPDGSTPNQ